MAVEKIKMKIVFGSKIVVKLPKTITYLQKKL